MDVKGHMIYEGRNPSPEHQSEWVLAQQDDPMVARLRYIDVLSSFYFCVVQWFLSVAVNCQIDECPTLRNSEPVEKVSYLMYLLFMILDPWVPLCWA